MGLFNEVDKFVEDLLKKEKGGDLDNLAGFNADGCNKDDENYDEEQLWINERENETRL